jgi:hypothetical protein
MKDAIELLWGYSFEILFVVFAGMNSDQLHNSASKRFRVRILPRE